MGEEIMWERLWAERIRLKIIWRGKERGREGRKEGQQGPKREQDGSDRKEGNS